MVTEKSVINIWTPSRSKIYVFASKLLDLLQYKNIVELVNWSLAIVFEHAFTISIICVIFII